MRVRGSFSKWGSRCSLHQNKVSGQFLVICTIYWPSNAPGNPRDAPGRVFTLTVIVGATRLYKQAMHLYAARQANPTGHPGLLLHAVLTLKSAAHALKTPGATPALPNGCSSTLEVFSHIFLPQCQNNC